LNLELGGKFSKRRWNWC